MVVSAAAVEVNLCLPAQKGKAQDVLVRRGGTGMCMDRPSALVREVMILFSQTSSEESSELVRRGLCMLGYG